MPLPLAIAEFGVRWLILTFGNVEAKEEFRGTWLGVEKLRMREEKEYFDAIRGRNREEVGDENVFMI